MVVNTPLTLTDIFISLRINLAGLVYGGSKEKLNLSCCLCITLRNFEYWLTVDEISKQKLKNQKH